MRPPRDQETKPPSSPLPPRRRRALIIEVAAAAATAIERALPRPHADWQVQWIESGTDIPEAVAARPWDLIVVTECPPHLDGAALARQVRERGSTAPLIVLARRPTVRRAVAAMRAGANDYLPRAQLDRLAAAAEALLQRDNPPADAVWLTRQQQAQQRERLADIGAIAAQIVHDLRNPLAGISMQGQLFLHRAQRDLTQPVHTMMRAVERIVGEAARLDCLLKEFTEASRHQRLDLQRVDLAGLLRSIVERWAPAAAAREITVTVRAPTDAEPITGDEEKLRRLFENLLKNAIEAIDRGPGRVEVSMVPAARMVHVSVADTGPGIPEAVEVFRLFQTTKAEGAGIGLTVAQQIALAHRGQIEYAPLQPRGSVFHVALPCAGPLG